MTSDSSARDDQQSAGLSRISRRGLLGLATAGVASVVIARIVTDNAGAENSTGQIVAREGSPATTPSPVVSPAASPLVSPAASPVASPGASPVPATALQIIRDQQPVETGTPVKGGELNLFVASQDLTDFTPTAFRQDFQITVSYLDPLVWADNITMEPKPWLASSWKWSKDGRTLTFTLRDDVTWHDGSKLTAQDVVFSFLVYRDDYDSAVATMFATMKDCQAPDDHTVKVSLDLPDGNFLFNAANLPIFQRNQYQDYWNQNQKGERTLSGFDWSKHTPIGTGPWKITDIGKDRINLERNVGYWAGETYTDRLVLTAEDDTTKRLDAWKQGDVDVVWPVPVASVPELLDQQGKLYTADAAVAMFAAFNFDNPKRSTPDIWEPGTVRQALSLAIDRDAYAREIFGGFVHQDRATTVAQPWAYDPSSVNPPRDVEKAKKLLADAGWKDADKDGILENQGGDSLNLTCIVEKGTRPELIATLRRLDTDLQPIGARFTVEELDPDAFNQRWVKGHDFDFIAYALTLYPGFMEYDLYGSKWNIRNNPVGWDPGGYGNKQVNAAIDDYLNAWQEDKMKAAVSAIQKQVAWDDLFALWLGFPQDLVLVRPDIHGYRPNKMQQTWDTRLLWRAPA